MEFVHDDGSDSDDDVPPMLRGLHRKVREKIEEVEAVLTEHNENHWQLGIVIDRISEMNERMTDIFERTMEISSGEDNGESGREVKEEIAEIFSKIKEFFEELKQMIESVSIIQQKNKTIREGLVEAARNINQLKGEEPEIEVKIIQSLADLKTIVMGIRQNITKAGVRLEEIDFMTRQIRKRIKQLQGEDEDDGDKRRCRVA